MRMLRTREAKESLLFAALTVTARKRARPSRRTPNTAETRLTTI